MISVKASLQTWLGWRKSSPCTNLFLLTQIHRAVIAHKSSSSGTHRSIIFRNTWEKLSHTSCAEGQFHRIWRTISVSLSHIGHRVSFTTFLWNKLSFVGRIFWHALHRNILTEFGTLCFHVTFQNTHHLCYTILLPCWVFWKSISMWQALLIEKSQFVVHRHISRSWGMRRLSGIEDITLASSSRKTSAISWWFQPFVTGSISSTTLASSNNILLGVCTA